MALTLIYADGFDDYTAPTLYWQTSVFNLGGGFIGAVGRNGNGIRMPNDSRSGWIRDLGPGVSVIAGTVMFAWRVPNHLPSRHAGIISLGQILSLNLNTDGSLYVTRGYYNGTYLAGSIVDIVANSTYHHIEMEFIINATTGRAKVYLDGNPTPIIDYTGNTGASAFNTVWLSISDDATSAGNMDFDDFILWSNGGTLHGQAGDHKVETLFPSGNGNSSQWVGSDGNSTDNYLLVDEAVPDTADYVASSTSGNKDTYALTNLVTTTGVVAGLQIQMPARKMDAGFLQIQPVIRHGTTDYDGADITLSEGYVYYTDPYDTNPGTASAFTIADVNALEVGVKVE